MKTFLLISIVSTLIISSIVGMINPFIGFAIVCAGSVFSLSILIKDQFKTDSKSEEPTVEHPQMYDILNYAASKELMCSIEPDHQNRLCIYENKDDGSSKFIGEYISGESAVAMDTMKKMIDDYWRRQDK